MAMASSAVSRYSQLIAFVVATLLLIRASANGQATHVGFYATSCPQAESIVQAIVKKYFRANVHVVAGLLHLHFIDCFIRGCDASLLINGPSVEKTALPNLSSASFEAIDDAKAQLEVACPGIVSCADIVALAARDSVALAGGPSWAVPTGRRDGLVSSANETSNLPLPTDSIEVQKQRFAEKGLDTQDLVTLVGAHTIGKTHCQFFRYRLYNFSGSSTGPDSTINSTFLPQLQASCPADGPGREAVPLDTGSLTAFDVSFFQNLRAGKGVLQSDQRLWIDRSTRAIVQRYASFVGGGAFNAEFPKAMVKLSNIGVLTGTEGQIRRVCRAFN